MPISKTSRTSVTSVAMHQGFSSSKPCPQLKQTTPATNNSSSIAHASHGHAGDQNRVNSSLKSNGSALPDERRSRLWNLKNCSRPQSANSLPWGLDYVSDFVSQLSNQNCRFVFFLDYDGTLAPIVDDPDSAFMPPPIRAALSEIASRFTTAIVTGRSKKKVMEMVQLDHLIYAGSHGFDIYAPDGRVSHRVASEYVPVMKRAARDLQSLITRFPGTRVEDNFLSITLHFRHVHPSLNIQLVTAVDDIASRHGLHRHDGKMVYELRPPHDWHKGKAVDYLLADLDLNRADIIPIYIGDDISDESAFLAIQTRGFSIIVAEKSLSRCTSADFRLRDPFEVGKFLMHFATHENLSLT